MPRGDHRLWPRPGEVARRTAQAVAKGDALPAPSRSGRTGGRAAGHQAHTGRIRHVDGSRLPRWPLSRKATVFRGRIPSVSDCPYPGLRSFRREESDIFFGRETQTVAMLEKIAATRFVTVVGQSGSGKSSL